MRVRRARQELLTDDMETPNAQAFYREWERGVSARLAKILTQSGGAPFSIWESALDLERWA